MASLLLDILPEAARLAGLRASASEGPFYFRAAGPDEIRLVLASGEVWGAPPRNFHQSDFPPVKANVGRLPPRTTGYEFTTPVVPRYSTPTERRWVEGMPGVRVEDGFAKIPATVTRFVTKEERWP